MIDLNLPPPPPPPHPNPNNNSSPPPSHHTYVESYYVQLEDFRSLHSKLTTSVTSHNVELNDLELSQNTSNFNADDDDYEEGEGDDEPYYEALPLELMNLLDDALYCSQQLIQTLASLLLHPSTLSSTQVETTEKLISTDCSTKFTSEVTSILTTICKSNSLDPKLQLIGAQCVEIGCIVVVDKDSIKALSNVYGEFITKILQNASKKSLRELTLLRKTTTNSVNLSKRIRNASHVKCISEILSTSSNLLLPLKTWCQSSIETPLEKPFESVKDNVYTVCKSSFEACDVEANKIVNAVWNWFFKDKSIQRWLDSSDNASFDVEELDCILEDLAFICEISTRYDAFVSDGLLPNNTLTLSKPSTTTNNLQDQLSKTYQTLETLFLQKSISTTLKLSQPLKTNHDDENHIPSFVEDAYYIFNKVFERASGTRCSSSIIGVGKVVARMYGKGGVVHKALIDGVGCKFKRYNSSHDNGVYGNGNGKGDGDGSKTKLFASALLNAFDDDDDYDLSGSNTSSSTNGDSVSNSAHVKSTLCNISGIHAACKCCISLSSSEAIERYDANHEIRAAFVENAKLYDGLLSDTLKELIGRYYDESHSTLSSLRDVLSRYDYSSGGDVKYTHFSTNASINTSLITILENNDLFKSLLTGSLGYPEDNVNEDHCLIKLVNIISSNIANVIYESLMKRIGKSTISPWGALLIGKQVRSITNALQRFSGHNHNNNSSSNNNNSNNNGAVKTIRTAFSKVNEMTNLLQLESISNYELFYGNFKEGGGKAVKVLGGREEVKRILSLRFDWNEGKGWGGC